MRRISAPTMSCNQLVIFANAQQPRVRERVIGISESCREWSPLLEYGTAVQSSTTSYSEFHCQLKLVTATGDQHSSRLICTLSRHHRDDPSDRTDDPCVFCMTSLLRLHTLKLFRPASALGTHLRLRRMTTCKHFKQVNRECQCTYARA